MAGVTVPPAAGEAEMVNCTSGEKFAVMLWAALIVTVVAALAMLATGPVQPVNTYPVFAVAVIGATVPAA